MPLMTIVRTQLIISSEHSISKNNFLLRYCETVII